MCAAICIILDIEQNTNPFPPQKTFSRKMPSLPNQSSSTQLNHRHFIQGARRFVWNDDGLAELMRIDLGDLASSLKKFFEGGMDWYSVQYLKLYRLPRTCPCRSSTRVMWS